MLKALTPIIAALFMISACQEESQIDSGVTSRTSIDDEKDDYENIIGNWSTHEGGCLRSLQFDSEKKYLSFLICPRDSEGYNVQLFKGGFTLHHDVNEISLSVSDSSCPNVKVSSQVQTYVLTDAKLTLDLNDVETVYDLDEDPETDQQQAGTDTGSESKNSNLHYGCFDANGAFSEHTVAKAVDEYPNMQ